MNPLRLARPFFFVATALVAVPLAAQPCPKGRCTELDPSSSTANYGTAVLDRADDIGALSLPGRSGGDVDASYLGGSCEGFATARPDHVLTLTDTFPDLELRAAAFFGDLVDDPVAVVVELVAGFRSRHAVASSVATSAVVEVGQARAVDRARGGEQKKGVAAHASS